MLKSIKGIGYRQVYMNFFVDGVSNNFIVDGFVKCINDYFLY